MPHCFFCAYNHPLKYCKKFQALTNKGRRQALDKYRVCTNCLSTSHILINCESLARCQYCEAKHHTILCRERPANVINTSFADVPDGIRIQPTIQALVTCANRSKLINFWVNDGPTSSFITQDMAGNLLGDAEVGRRTIAMSLTLSVPDAPWVKFNGIFQIKGTYNFPSQQAIHDYTLRQHLSLLQPIANPSFEEPQEFDGVIGKNILPLIVLSTSSPNIGPLSSLPTKFGWVVSGPWAGCQCGQHKGQRAIIDITGGGVC